MHVVPDKQRTEITFQVTIEHFVTESDPSPTEQDVWNALDDGFSRGGVSGQFDVGDIWVTKEH